MTVFSDINDRMPREEAKALFEVIKPIGTFSSVIPSERWINEA
jgi:hypothetical protein